MVRISNEYYEEQKDQLITVISDKFKVPRDEVGEFVDMMLQGMGRLNEDTFNKALFDLRGLCLSHFTKPLFEQDFDAVFIGITRQTDFGKTQKYDEAVQVYKINPQKAIHQGLTNEKGQPIEAVPFQPGKTRVIDKENLFSRTLYGVTKIDGETKPFQFALRGEKSNMIVPLFVKVRISGYKSKKQDDKWVRSGSTMNTKMYIQSEDVVELDKFLKYFDNEVKITLDEIENPKADVWKEVPFFIVEATIKVEALDNKYKVTFIPRNKNAVDRLNVFEGLDDIRTYTGFVDEKPDYVENGIGYIVGRSFLKRTGEIGFEIYGIYTSKPFLL